MKNLFDNRVETSVKTDTFRIAKKMREIIRENPTVNDGEAW